MEIEVKRRCLFKKRFYEKKKADFFFGKSKTTFTFERKKETKNL